MGEKELQFPLDFRWGTATAAHQVEGDPAPSDWWAWEQVPSHVKDGTDAGRAGEWWKGRYIEDFDLAQAMGQNALRLSLDWSRIEPRKGEWDGEAIARYRQMLAALRDRGIEPMVTLFHFVSPLWLAEQGGWENEDVVRYFERFAARVVEECGDLVNLWCTINEPNVYGAYSYLLGNWPPQKRDIRLAFRVIRHQLLAHAFAYRAIHRLQPMARVGLAQHLRVFDPMQPHSTLDRWAAGAQDYLFNRLVLDPPVDGVLPFPLSWNTKVPELADSQDYIGLNYYSRDMVSFDITKPQLLFGRRSVMPGTEFSMEGWGEIYPEGLYRLLKRLQQYGKPIYVTEFGVPDNDDSKRPRFLITHLSAVYRAIAEGVPVKGVYFWSLVDNFEWAEGFSARFGLIGLDLQTGKRTLKSSGQLYGEICRQGAITLEMVERYAPELKELLFQASDSA
ncbi:MAG: glycoside hydrolase family 1 protein [Chloroflexi bacterium]|nr:glycoside hydrolase family 1 protein [Chloroflexota bacterium]